MCVMFRLFCASVDFSEIAKQCLQINGGIKCDDVLPSESTHTQSHTRNPQMPLDVFKMSYMAPLYIASKTQILYAETLITHMHAQQNIHISLYFCFSEDFQPLSLTLTVLTNPLSLT